MLASAVLYRINSSRNLFYTKTASFDALISSRSNYISKNIYTKDYVIHSILFVSRRVFKFGNSFFLPFQKRNVKQWCKENLRSVTKYLRLTLVFMWNSALREKFNCYFWDIFATINKIFILAGRLGTSLSFYGVSTLS